ncbi:protein CUSTOS isoform X2 [Brachionichthys hirsutus]|uniref:protein CUSTOS isoform X2 n=1 Tax=Brachionichthys hirsutus TaxID=412623 RepID=UPI003604587F
MAAPSGKMLSDSSSSDDEALRRCQEAVWETRRDEKRDGDADVRQSKRVVVAQHEHDGNELGVTQGFREHVAKKLGAFLDGCVTEQQSGPPFRVKAGESDDDEGFRLFSTSVPGQTGGDPPAPVKRRPVPSSSDSDGEMEKRLKEAAVSIRDLLPSLSPPAGGTEGEESHRKRKRKRKRKPSPEGSGAPPQSDGEQQVKAKRKKKKRNGAADAPN